MTGAIVVTGGAGFIGSSFVRHALAHGEARVVVFDKLTYAGNLESLADVERHPRFTFVRGAIESSSDVNALLDAFRPSAIVNLAAETHVDRSIEGPRAFVQTNVVGTSELLHAAERAYAAMPPGERASFRFLHVSTDEVYGSLEGDGAFTEETPYAPRSPYAASKAGGDHLVRAYRETYGLPTLTTHAANNYGPYQYPEKLIPLVLLNALEGKSIPLYGDGLHVRDWLFVEDHCAALFLALTRGRPGARYNVGARATRTNVAVVDAVCAALERVAPAAQNAALAARGARAYADLKTFVVDRPGHDRRCAVDAARLRDELGWAPTCTFEEGLARTVRWYLENRAWCDAVQSGKYHRERLGASPMPTV